MIYTVTLEPALDYVLELPEALKRGVNRASSASIGAGGKGINVSIMLTRLGAKNTALGFRAGFTGQQLAAMLSDMGVKNELIALPCGNTRINVKLRDGGELDINAPGPKVPQGAVQKLLSRLSSVCEEDIVVLAGNASAAFPQDIYARLLKAVSSSKARCIVDTSGRSLLSSLQYKPFLIKPNREELGELFGVKVSTERQARRYASTLIEMGAQNVIVSLGSQGALLVTGSGGELFCGALPGKIVDSVGCGDSMVAGFASGYAERRDPAYAFKLACACSNATAFTYGLADCAAVREAFEKL